MLHVTVLNKIISDFLCFLFYEICAHYAIFIFQTSTSSGGQSSVGVRSWNSVIGGVQPGRVV